MASWQPTTRSSRSIVTFIEEPPLHSTIPERPCIVALVQDNGFYDKKSTNQWQDALRHVGPNQLGITVANFEWNDLRKPTADDNRNILEQGLEALQMDMDQLMSPHVILVARGPLVSWVSQLYLESFSVAGLVLVDPLPLDDNADNDDNNNDDNILDADQFSQAIQDYANDFPGVLHEHTHLENFLSDTNSKQGARRPLLLEPGAVPTMIVQSIPVPLFIAGSQQTADRHRLSTLDRQIPEDDEDVESDVPKIHLDAQANETDVHDFLQHKLSAWIERRVL